MAWLIAFAVVLALVVGALCMLRRRPEPTAGSRVVGATLGLTRRDIEELSRTGSQVEAEFRKASTRLLVLRLADVVRHNVPLQAVRPGSCNGLARVCFADGTTLQVRGRREGDLNHLADHAITDKVWMSDFHTVRRDLVLDFDWRRGHLSVLAVGLDQAD